ncbi:MAG: UDP-N-acetylmuramate dehydrogenase [Dysgonamonadaceae bacterium]|jgi:UDP-N-acetylmuramate dehydrogenase|nr:UDP-N-acetylmuramate dehydrogenase [Dysgonamonadaceae bacterium]
MRIEQNYSLLKYNTFRLNVKTRWFVEYANETDLQQLLHDEYFFSQPFWHIGQGSNLLFLGDYDGVIVHSGIRGIAIQEEDVDYVRLKVGAAEIWDDLVAFCVNNGWGGIENLSLIPGEVGASAVQNIGAYGTEVAGSIEEVHAFSLQTGEKKVFGNEECHFSYRHSFFKDSANRGLYYITHVVFRLNKKPQFKLEYGNIKDYLSGKEINLTTVRNAIIAIRKTKLPDPDRTGNAGSFFTNPYIGLAHYGSLKKDYPEMPHYPVDNEVVKIPAAWLIEQCGLKGKTVGGAAVHEQQPLVIINRNNATGNDIARLAEEIRQAVKEKFSIELQPEVNYIG